MKKTALMVWVCLIVLFLISIVGCSKPERVITSLEDANDARVGVMTGTTGEKIALDRLPHADIKSFDDIMDAVTALKSGQIDAIITAYPTALNTSNHNPDLGLLAEPIEYEDTSIAVKKGNEELLGQIDALISEFKKDGTLEDMKRRWFKTDLSPYDEIKLNLPETGTVLRVGVSATREPISFVDANQKVSGHDGELANRIAVKLGRPIEFSNMKFSSLIPALQSGKVDLIITGMSSTDERRKTIDFSQSYFSNAQVIMIKKVQGGSVVSKKMTSLSDIGDKRVGVYEGTIYDAFVETTFPQAKILRYSSPADMILSLKNNKVDVVLLDAISANVMLKSNEGLGVLTDEVLTKSLGIGFNKNNPVLRSKFNDFLKTIQADGTYDEMYARWCVNNPEEAVIPEFKDLAEAQEVILGVAVADLPYVAVMNGNYVGFDIEMIKRFAQHEGLRLEIKTMEFSSLIAALASGKVNMIADGIAITEERQKQIDFSDKYMDFKTAAVSLKENITKFDKEEKQITTSIPLFKSVGDSFYNNVILENRYLLILDGLKITVLTSIFAVIFGTLLGGLICYLRMSRQRVLNLIARIYIAILRGTPVLVLLMLIYYVAFASVDISPVFVAVIAFGMNFAAYVAEMYRTGIEGVDKGQTEAGIAMGFTKAKTFFYIVMPQAVRRILPVYKGEVISLVKMTSVVGYIAVQDLTKASDIIRSRTYDAFFPLIMVAILYFLISWLLMLSLGYFERLTDPKAKKGQVKKAA